jgi:phage protein D
VILAVQAGAIPEVLIDGVITHHQLAPSDEPGQSTLTVTGKDLTALLDLTERNASYPNQPDSLIVTRVLARYAQYGLVPQPAPTTNVPIEIDRIPRQQETDLKFVQRLAQQNGFVFYIEPKSVGVNIAHWGPEIRGGFPQAALTLGMGAAANLKSLSFSQDALAASAPEGKVVEPITKIGLPIPQLPSLRVPPLALTPTPARRTTLLRDTAGQNPAEAATAAVAATSRAPDPVTGEGELDSSRYGRVLRARQLVAVRGAGLSYDGLYYVRRVTHSLAPGEYTQKFSISREGTRSTIPVVPT